MRNNKKKKEKKTCDWYRVYSSSYARGTEIENDKGELMAVVQVYLFTLPAPQNSKTRIRHIISNLSYHKTFYNASRVDFNNAITVWGVRK
jgi:hypothetical protein